MKIFESFMIAMKLLSNCDWHRLATLAIVALFLTIYPSYSRAADEADVRQAGKDYLAAVQRGDTKAMADCWTAEGSYTAANGKTTKVHDLLSKPSTANPAVRLPTNLTHVSVRFIADDVALENADYEMAAANGTPPVHGRYSALWVLRDGRWKLDSLRESRDESANSGADELASLAVLAGEWTGQLNDATIHISAKWDATKKFLRRDFSAASITPSIAGTQEIGWDPIAGRVKSWMFLDDGSFGEGLWSLQGTVWMEVSSRVLPDGRVIKAVQVYKFTDKNTLTWKLIHGSVDGQPAKTMEVTFKRS
jgi:uncharacterized protein (TIGR02246 family)